MSVIENSAEIIDNAVMNETTKDKVKNLDINDLAEWIKSDLEITRQFHNLIMQKYEGINPKNNELRKLYFDTQTLCWVLMDRLLSLEDKANELVKKLYSKSIKHGRPCFLNT